MGMKFTGVTKRIGDDVGPDGTMVVRVILRPDGFSIDLLREFEMMLEKMPDAVQVGEELIEIFARTIRMHTGLKGEGNAV